MRRILSHKETQEVFSRFPLQGSEDVWYKKWMTLCRNARHYDYANCYLSFEDYLTLAYDVGVLDPTWIGAGLGKYQMARIGDVGDYKTGNCRFVMREQNIQEWRENGGREVCSKVQLGRRKETHIGVKSMAEKMIDISSKRYEVRAPDGTVHKGRNLKLLLKAHGLNSGCMSLVLNSHRAHHRGWTGHYIEEGDLQ